MKIEVLPQVIDYYENKEDLFDIPRGTIWAHIKYMPEYDIGNPMYGALLLCWNKEGNCQKEVNWCGGAFVIPGQYATSKYFRLSYQTGMVPKIYANLPIDEKVDTTIQFADGTKKKLSTKEYLNLRMKL
jgi:hypothetical protein